MRYETVARKNLLDLFHKSGCPEFSIILDKAPPEVCEGNGGGMPESMSIYISMKRREVVNLQKHCKSTSEHSCPQLEARGMTSYTTPDYPHQNLRNTHHKAHFHIPPWQNKRDQQKKGDI